MKEKESLNYFQTHCHASHENRVTFFLLIAGFGPNSPINLNTHLTQ